MLFHLHGRFVEIVRSDGSEDQPMMLLTSLQVLGIHGGEGLVAFDHNAQRGTSIKNETSQRCKQHLKMRVARQGDDLAVKLGVELIRRAKVARGEADVGLLYDDF